MQCYLSIQQLVLMHSEGVVFGWWMLGIKCDLFHWITVSPGYPLPFISLPSVSYDHIQGVMALTLFEDFVYWTDGKSKSLRRAHKTSGAQAIELLNSWQAIKSIKVYHSLRQPEGKRLRGTPVVSSRPPLASV